MNYKEATAYALTVRWKTEVCNQGKTCWCRIVTPVKKIYCDDGNEVIICHAASLSKKHAEHIVKLHNQSLVK